MKYYYLNEDREPQGPFPAKQIVEMLSDDKLSMTTYVAEEGGADWKELKLLLSGMVIEKELPSVPQASGSSVRNGGKASYQKSPVFHDPETSQISMELFWAFLGVTCAATFSYVVGMLIENPFLLAMYGLTSVASLVIWLVLHYKCWNRIPADYLYTSPVKAIGFLFIPLFNLYWIFISMIKLGEGIDRWSFDRKIEVKPFLAYGVILSIFMVLKPFLFAGIRADDNVILIVAVVGLCVEVSGTILFFLYYWGLTKTINTLCDD